MAVVQRSPFVMVIIASFDASRYIKLYPNLSEYTRGSTRSLIASSAGFSRDRTNRESKLNSTAGSMDLIASVGRDHRRPGDAITPMY